jgi:hypothetical protein
LGVPGLLAVHVTLCWGDVALRAFTLSGRRRSFVLGAGGDWELPERALGATRFQLLEVCQREAILTVPPGAEVFVAGATGRPFRSEPIHRLVAGARARVDFGGFGVDVEVTSAREGAMSLRLPTAGAVPHHVLSAAAHLGVLALLCTMARGSGAEEGTDTEHARERLAFLTELGDGDSGKSPGPAIHASHEQPIVDTTVPVIPAPFPHARYGRPSSPKMPAVRGSAIGGSDAASLAETLGAKLAPSGGGSPSAWASREGNDGGTVAALRKWGADGGLWGLRLSGVGEGGGGRGEGISIGDIGSLGQGSGVSGGYGIAGGHGRIGGTHTVGAPRLRCGATLVGHDSGGCAVMVNGRLPPEVIQRVVEENFGRFRLCYLDGLRRNPMLSGRVTTRFVIARDGSVWFALDDGSDLPDDSVVSCVVRTFEALAFPEPEGGTVSVIYPLMFSSE